MDVPRPPNRAGCNSNISNIGSPVQSFDDPFGVAAMMSFDGYSELCSPSIADQIFSLLNDPSSPQQMFAMWSSSGSSPRASAVREDMSFDAYPGPVDVTASLAQPALSPTRVDRGLKDSDGIVPNNGLQQGGNIIPRSVGVGNFDAMTSFDGYSELCSPSIADQIFSLLNDPSVAQQMFAMWPSLGSSPRASAVREDMSIDTYPVDVTASALNSTGVDRGLKDSDGLVPNNGSQQGSNIIPRSISNFLADRMLMALSLFRRSLSDGVLAQVWVPVEHNGRVMLSTSEQPYLLDKNLAGYREVSRNFWFSVKEEPGLHLELPGRVFMSGVPEWTSSIAYYSKPEYLRMDHALLHRIRGSLAMPVYDPSKGSCCAVIELVTNKEKPDFDAEMDIICNALQAVNLQTTTHHNDQKVYSENQKSAFTEILDFLRAICHVHTLPLALTWVPTPNSANGFCVGQNTGVDSQLGKAVLRINESACYVNDAKVLGFLHACADRHLEKGQGIAGRALKSNLPFFSPDIREYSIEDYPLAHHARKFGLHAAVAIRLRTTYTGNDDYILEFFLPVNCKGCGEQQMLLNNISSTMQRICKSLRTVSEAEIENVSATAPMYERTNGSCLPTCNSESSSHDEQPITESTFQDLSLGDKQGGRESDKAQSNSMRVAETKRGTSEKNFSLNVLRKYFNGSIRDAAMSLGVCPTTSKRTRGKPRASSGKGKR